MIIWASTTLATESPVMAQVNGMTLVNSDAPELPDPPPDSATWLLTCGGALSATLTVTTIGGYDAPGASGFAVAQAAVESVQVQPVPPMDTRVRPAGTLSETVTVPLV